MSTPPYPPGQSYTPESAAFLAKKPAVPPTFEGVDYDDTKALKAAQDAIIREQWVRSMMARLVREELGKCYYKEGVNHLEKCTFLRGGYYSVAQKLFSANRAVKYLREVPGAAKGCKDQGLLVPYEVLYACREGVRPAFHHCCNRSWLWHTAEVVSCSYFLSRLYKSSVYKYALSKTC